MADRGCCVGCEKAGSFIKANMFFMLEGRLSVGVPPASRDTVRESVSLRGAARSAWMRDSAQAGDDCFLQHSFVGVAGGLVEILGGAAQCSYAHEGFK
jgi:hypothetical protein